MEQPETPEMAQEILNACVMYSAPRGLAHQGKAPWILARPAQRPVRFVMPYNAFRL